MNVRFGSEADIEARFGDARFTPESGYSPTNRRSPSLSSFGCEFYYEFLQRLWLIQ
jgi:hypothetical protein